MVKTQIKNLESALGSGEATKAQDQLKVLTRKLDKLSTTSTLHKNTAARIKSRLTRQVNALSAKTAG